MMGIHTSAMSVHHVVLLVIVFQGLLLVVAGKFKKNEMKMKTFSQYMKNDGSAFFHVIHTLKEKQNNNTRSHNTTFKVLLSDSSMPQAWRRNHRKVKRSSRRRSVDVSTGKQVPPKPAIHNRFHNLQKRSPDVNRGSLNAVKCLGDRMAFNIALRARKTWAQKMADSSGHVGSGILDREVDLIGIREECLSVEVPHILNFHSQFCVASLVVPQVHFPEQLKTPSPTGLSMAICLPSTCDRHDVTTIIQNNFQQRHLTHLSVDHVQCSHDDEPALSAGVAGMVTFLCLWIVLVLLSTALHDVRVSWPKCKDRRGSQGSQQRTPRRVHYKREVEEHQLVEDQEPLESSMVNIEFNIDSNVSTTGLARPHQLTARSVPRRPSSQQKRRGILRNKYVSLLRSDKARFHDELNNLRQLIRCFSLKLHVKTLFDTSRSKTEIRCLHGVRVLSFAWLVLADCVLNQTLFVRNTFPLLEEWRHHRLLYSIVGNGHLSYDSLFTVSGLSVGYVFSFQLEKKMGQMNWVKYILARYWKIVPTMAMVGMMYLALFPALVSGPLSISQAPDQQQCLQWGWMNVLLMHNMLHDVCMSWTWFLAVDFQLFLLTPFLLILLYHKPCLAYLSVCVIVLASCVANGVLTITHHVPVALFVLPDKSNSQADSNFTSWYLHKPWTHAGAFYPPLLLGYLLQRCKQRGSFRWRTLAAGWLMVFAASMAVVFSTSRVLVGEHSFSEEGEALYNAVQSTVWSLCVCWLVLVCSAGYGGCLHSLLSWSGWKPLSRLVLGGYLLYPVVLRTYNASLEQLAYATTAVLIYHFWAVLGYSLLLSAVLCVTVEMPFNALLSKVCSCCVTFDW